MSDFKPRWLAASFVPHALAGRMLPLLPRFQVQTDNNTSFGPAIARTLTRPRLVQCMQPFHIA